MARHPHRIMLRDKKTWKCMLPGCRYFIHLGLTHTLPGQMIICWECGDQFMCDDDCIDEAKESDMPKCSGCRMRLSGVNLDAIGDLLEEKGLLNRPTGLAAFGAKNYVPGHLKPVEPVAVKPPKDEVEVIEPDEEHAPDCSVYIDGECSCK